MTTWTCEWCGMAHGSALEYNNHACSKRVPPVTGLVERLRHRKAADACRELKDEAASEIERLRDLCKLQHEALKAEAGLGNHMGLGPSKYTQKAIAAYEEFNK